MADLTMALSQADMSKWAGRLAADDWSWVTWKYFLGDSILLLLWLVFMFTLVSMIVPGLRRKLVNSSKLPVNGSVIFSGFICTWLIADLAHGAIFGPGPYGYWLQSWLGDVTFSEVADWTNRRMTLLGLVFSNFS